MLTLQLRFRYWDHFLLWNNVFRVSEIAEHCPATKSQLHCFSRFNRFKKHKIFQRVNCSGAYVILVEYTLCKKRYVGKTETAFNILLNNHRNDIKTFYRKTILACKQRERKIITSSNMQNSLLQANLPTEKTWWNSATTLNLKTKRLDLNIRQHIPIYPKGWTKN